MPAPIENWGFVPDQNSQYTSLRMRAAEELDAKMRCVRESQQAYKRGDKSRVRALKNEGKKHEAAMKRFNDEASAWIFKGKSVSAILWKVLCRPMGAYVVSLCSKRITP